MITCFFLFNDDRFAISLKRCKNKSRFYLSRGHRQLVMNRFKGLATVHFQWWQITVCLTRNLYTHLTQWNGHTVHRTFWKGIISKHLYIEILTCKHTWNQANRCPRVTHIQLVLRSLETIKTNTVNAYHITIILDSHTQITEDLHSWEDILTS